MVATVGAGTFTLVSALTYAYQNALATTTSGQKRFQVIRVPQYQNFTLDPALATSLTAPAWNGSTGGVLVLDVAGTLTLNGKTIDLKGKGFRGGAGRQLGGPGGTNGTGAGQNGFTLLDYRTANTALLNASKGEGIAGTPRYVNPGGVVNPVDLGVTVGYPNGATVGGGDNGRGAPGNAGGGGTDTDPSLNDENTGGGGGSNGGTGGQGGNGWQSNLPSGGFGGAAFLLASPSRLVIGGGGGAGTSNNGTLVTGPGLTTNGFASSGAPGGGMALLRVANVSGSTTGTIDVSGADMDFVASG